MFRTVCVKRAARSVRIHIVRAPNTDRHIIIRAGKHPAILSANTPSSETKPPPTGRILPLADAQRPNPQSVEQSSRKPVFQRDKTPSHWRKRDANRPLSVRKTPVSGGINPLVGLSSPDSSSRWRNHPGDGPFSGQKIQRVEGMGRLPRCMVWCICLRALRDLPFPNHTWPAASRTPGDAPPSQT